MSDPIIRAAAERITQELIAKGEIIEAGFTGYRMLAMSADAPKIQVDECRLAFFAGAQHLFGSITSTLDPGAEPTDADLARLDSIKLELDRFIAAFTRDRIQTKGRA